MTDLYYWDSCVFIAWLKGEDPHRTKDEIEGLREVVSKVEKGTANLITSTITNVEVLEFNVPVGTRQDFEKLLQRRQMMTISVDIRISNLASQLRNYYKDSKEHTKTLCTPDAIHLATAILYKASEFHTFDYSNNRTLGLLRLSGDVGGHQLLIKKPSSRQLNLV